jgi:hypothetical protein
VKAFTLTEPAPKLGEADVAADIKKWLKTRRWHVMRLQSGVVNFGQNPDGSPRLRQLGRKGMADFVAWRPLNYGMVARRFRVTTQMQGLVPGLVELFFYEVKQPGKKPSEDQEKWLSLRQAEGFLATFFDSVDAMQVWYSKHFSEAC